MARWAKSVEMGSRRGVTRASMMAVGCTNEERSAWRGREERRPPHGPPAMLVNKREMLVVFEENDEENISLERSRMLNGRSLLCLTHSGARALGHKIRLKNGALFSAGS